MKDPLWVIEMQGFHVQIHQTLFRFCFPRDQELPSAAPVAGRDSKYDMTRLVLMRSSRGQGYQNPRNLPNLNFQSNFQLVLSKSLGGLATHFENSTHILYCLLNVDRRSRQSAMKSQPNKQPGSGSRRHLDKLPDGLEARDRRTIEYRPPAQITVQVLV
ncbi:hypothetical protein Peur_006114 [Populus x canadensis]